MSKVVAITSATFSGKQQFESLPKWERGVVNSFCRPELYHFHLFLKDNKALLLSSNAVGALFSISDLDEEMRKLAFIRCLFLGNIFTEMGTGRVVDKNVLVNNANYLMFEWETIIQVKNR